MQNAAKTLIILLLTIPGLAVAKPAVDGRPPNICHGLAESLKQVAQQIAPSHLESTGFYANTAEELLGDFRRGNIREYLSLKMLAPRFTKAGYVPLSQLIAIAFKSQVVPILSTSLDELKTIPFAQANSHFVFIIKDHNPLTQERVQAVVATAVRMKIIVSVFWTASGDFSQASITSAAQNSQEGRDLVKTLVGATGGRFIELDSQKNRCFAPI